MSSIAILIGVVILVAVVTYYFRRRKLSVIDRRIIRREVEIKRSLVKLQKIKVKRDKNNREYLNALAKYNTKYGDNYNTKYGDPDHKY